MRRVGFSARAAAGRQNRGDNLDLFFLLSPLLSSLLFLLPGPVHQYNREQ